MVRNCAYVRVGAAHRWHAILVGGLFKTTVWGRRASVARSVLILRICTVSLIWVLPLTLFLFFEHRLNIFLHRHRELSICVHWCVVTRIQFGILVVYIHAATARKVSIAEDHALLNFIK